VGARTRAIVDRVEDGEVQARSVWQADDIDGITLLSGADGLEPGTLVDVRIDDVVDDVNFAATVMQVTSAPLSGSPRRRGLPIAAGGSISSFGR
jgi:hypothetical protein